MIAFIWTDDIEDKLITLVEERPLLYDVATRVYSKKGTKPNAKLWGEIEEALNISVKEIRKHWDSLRTQYTRYKKLATSGSQGAKRTERQQWVLERLQFLAPHCKQKETTSKINLAVIKLEDEGYLCELSSSSIGGDTEVDPTDCELGTSCEVEPIASAGPVESRMSTRKQRMPKRRRNDKKEPVEEVQLVSSIGKAMEKLTQLQPPPVLHNSAFLTHIDHLLQQMSPRQRNLFMQETTMRAYNIVNDTP